MSQRKAQPVSSGNPSQIAVGIFEDDNEKPIEVLREPVPIGFPPELAHHLAEYMARGFNVAVEEVPSLEGFGSNRGRPSDDEAEREGYEGAKLREKGFTFGEIARQVCRYRNKPGHRCKKSCTDRIRQAMRRYERRQEEEKIVRGEPET
jgi:hypothetical protein